MIDCFETIIEVDFEIVLCHLKTTTNPPEDLEAVDIIPESEQKEEIKEDEYDGE